MKKLVESSSLASEFDRQQVNAFLEQKEGQDYVHQSGPIVGILKVMKDEMEVNLKKLQTDEAEAVMGFSDRTACKNTEVAAAAEAIKTKTARAGSLAVSVVQAQGDIGDT